MTKREILDKLKLPNVLILLSIIFLSCALLILTNYFTIKILSANRAYVNGESHYSKGQKDAVRHLITYLYTEEPVQWELFKEELRVPQGDGQGRIALSERDDIPAAKAGFRAGRNHEDDLDDMVWIFRNFQSVPFFKKAVLEWEQGDALIDQLDDCGQAVHQKIQTSGLDDISKKKYLEQISNISDKLTINERNFSNTLGEGTREIRNYLVYTNVIFILIIICSVSVYYAVMVKKIMQTKKEIENKNDDLLLANKELDKFVYSASHDLRSPITSLKGLVEILKMEDDPAKTKEYLNLMEQVLTKQDNFISDIIDYSRNKRTGIIIEPVNLNELVDDVIKQHQYIEGTGRIHIQKEILTPNLFSDKLRIKIILNNLLSNAIKYADLTKSNPSITIKAYSTPESTVIEVQDNGIGINKEFLERIFDMFFVTNNNKGTGLGLYIVKEAIENMQGHIEVASEINIGTKFTVTLPHHEHA